MQDGEPRTGAGIAQRLGLPELLGRLLAKSVIAHEAEGRRYLYRPLVCRDDHVERESRRLIDRLFGGRLSPLVAHLAERDALTERDIADIEALLKGLKA